MLYYFLYFLIACVVLIYFYMVSPTTKYNTIEKLNSALDNGKINEEQYFLIKSRIMRKQEKKNKI